MVAGGRVAAEEGVAVAGLVGLEREEQEVGTVVAVSQPSCREHTTTAG
jgi:hypothetical protein